MATVKLKNVTMVGKRSELDDIAAVLGRTGMFQPDNAKARPNADPMWEGFSGENPYTEPLQALRDALRDTGKEKEVTLLDSKDANTAALGTDEAIAYAEGVTAKLREESRAIAEAEAKLEGYAESLRDIKYFIGKNLDFSAVKGAEHVAVVFGYLPEENLEKLHLYETKQKLHFTSCQVEGGKNWGFYLVPSDQEEEIRRIYSVLKFHEIQIDRVEGRPEQMQEQLKASHERQANAIAQAKAHLDAYWSTERSKVQVVYTYLTERNVYYSAICKNAAVFGESFILVGWIPSNLEKSLTADLAKFSLSTLNFEGGKVVEKYNPPKMLKTPFIFRPFEMFTKMYGVPGAQDVSPTILTGIVYPILFGIMFGDVGQGACIGILAFILYKMGKLPVGALLVPCSICSVIFGFFYGSVFGVETWLNPIHQALGIDLNHHAGKFVEVMEAETSPLIIYFTMGLGVIIMTICMIINIINKFRHGHAGEAIFGTSGIAGLAFYLGLAGVLAGLIVPDLCAAIGFNGFNIAWLLGMLAAPLVLIFFREPLGDLVEGKGIHFEDGFGAYCMQNIFELIEVAISTMSNVMSYLRVGAFVLVHAGMMQVVYSLCQAFGGSNPVIYIIIAVIGNGLISVLEALLVCIQVLRLNFYEMYNRFYLGDGREFEPVDARKAAAV